MLFVIERLGQFDEDVGRQLDVLGVAAVVFPADVAASVLAERRQLATREPWLLLIRQVLPFYLTKLAADFAKFAMIAFSRRTVLFSRALCSDSIVTKSEPSLTKFLS